jgi:hypothetical protein
MDFTSSRLQNFLSFTKQLLATINRWKFISFRVKIGLLIVSFTTLWGVLIESATQKHSSLSSAAQDIKLLSKKKEEILIQKKMYQTMKEHALKADVNYLSNLVGNMMFLKSEREKLHALSKHFPNNPALKERLSFLEEDQNRALFEQVQETTPFFVHYRMKKRVHMNDDDLRNFLAAVEKEPYDISSKKPLFRIKRMDLLKCYEKGDGKVYSVEIELLQDL